MGPLPSSAKKSAPPPCYAPDQCSSDAAVPPPPPSPYPPPPPSPASHGRSTFVTALTIAGPLLAFLAICLAIFILVRCSRQQQRRRREALLEAALGTFPNDNDGGGGGGGGGEVTHHVWHIRTVGLDEAAIQSIALAPYRAGGGASDDDCTVCLGEFQDGELLRLLPKCAHAFHVQCIDTWLRAHVTCPLCRADVVVDRDPPAAEQPDQAPGTDAAAADAALAAEQFGSNSTQTTEQEERPDRQANDELRVQIDQQHDDVSALERRPCRQVRQPGARARNFRRVASMDSPALPPTATASAEDAPDPEDDLAGGEKQGTGGAVCCEVEVSPESGQVLKRSLSSSGSSRWTLLPRHSRARSSLLPL